MSRKQGTLKLSSNIEPLAASPLDARTVVPTLADLTASGAFPYPYVGMIVSVQATGKVYILTASDPTVSANWTEIGSGGGDSIQVEELPDPATAPAGAIYQYVGETTANYIYGHFYKRVAGIGEWIWSECEVQTESTKIFKGTTTEWNNLPRLNKIEYDEAHFTDDFGDLSGLPVDPSDTSNINLWLENGDDPVPSQDFNFQSGTENNITVSPGANTTFSVSLLNAMPDTEYVATVSTVGTSGGLLISIWYKTTTSFMVTVYNSNAFELTEDFAWEAFRIPHAQ